MTVTQQQQQALTRQGEQVGAKPRKRKSKPQQQSTVGSTTQIQQSVKADAKQQTETDKTTATRTCSENPSANQRKINTKKQEKVLKQQQVNAATEKNIDKPQQKQSIQELPPIVKDSNKDSGKTDHPTPANRIGKQLSAEDTDDIDAGIELDGSSNSGSSIKDMNDEQTKSTSVSPVMTQSNLINENRHANHAVAVAPMEQITGSICSDLDASTKKVGTTKKQLAANQQVIDADEQLHQQKQQSKQRKLSLQDGIANDSSTSSPSAPQSPALCKVCDQHVYQMERMLAEKAVYHKQCFRCFKCKVQLRIDNYSSHEGQVYCKAHHREIFQPQAKFDADDDADIVAKSIDAKKVDDYLLHRGKLSELSFSFLQQHSEGIRKRQMIICENQPAELPKDVVRCDTKVDDGIDRLNLNLNNILEKFERGAAGEDNQQSPTVVEKTSFDIKKTLMAFETNSINSTVDAESSGKSDGAEKPVVRKLRNINDFLNTNRQSSTESEPATPSKPIAVRRSESLMVRLKKYESRIAGEQVADEDSDDDVNNNGLKDAPNCEVNEKRTDVPKKLTRIDLSSLKSQWENGDMRKKRIGDHGESNRANTDGPSDSNGNSPIVEKNEELCRVRQQLARKKSGESGSIRNIYENAIRESRLQQDQQTSRSNSSDLSALNGFSTSQIQKQLLQNNSCSNQSSHTPTSPNKDHFQLNLSNKANRLKEKFEQGLITNGSLDDSDQSDSGDAPALTKLEQIRQEKLEDLSIFKEGEITAREARNMFQQIDRRLSAGGQQSAKKASASMTASIKAKMMTQMGPNAPETTSRVKECARNNHDSKNHHNQGQQPADKQPIRLTNNVRT